LVVVGVVEDFVFEVLFGFSVIVYGLGSFG